MAYSSQDCLTTITFDSAMISGVQTVLALLHAGASMLMRSNPGCEFFPGPSF